MTTIESDGGLNLGGNGGSPYFMPVMPAYGFGGMGGGMNGGFGGGWGEGIWAIILLAMIMGIGNRGIGGGYGGGGYGGAPIIIDSNNHDHDRDYGYNGNIQDQFNHQAVMANLNGLTSSVSNGFANAEVSRCNAQTNILQTLNANQNATTAAMNGLAMSLQNCCCENRAATADLKYTIATENCADRAAVTDGIRDILTATQAQTQTILDKLCQQEIEAKNETIANLRSQLNMATLAASQIDQTAQIRAGQTAAVNSLVNELRSCPIPAQPVYGSQPIFTCPNNNGFGCQGVQ